MYSRLKWQNLYRTKLAADLTPITQGAWDDPTTEFSFDVEVAPAVSKWYVYIDFTKDAKRDLIYFHRKSGTTLYYYRGNRDLESNGVYGITHTKGSFLQLNDVDKWIDRTFDTVDDLWYIDVISNKKIKIFGGTTYFKWVQKVVADTAFQTLADGTRYAVLDYSDETLKFVAAVDYDSHLWFATVIMASWAVSSITNHKWEQLHANKTTLDLFVKDWTRVRYNTFLVWDVLWPWSSTDNNIVTMDGATGKKVKDSGKSISTDWTFASNSDNKVPTEKAVKTYADTKIPFSYLQTIISTPWSNTKVPTEKAIIDFFNSLPPWPAWPAWQGITTVDIIFDDHANDLPSDTSVQIDWHTVITWDLVYVKDCSDALKIWNIYEATVIWTTITWVFSSTPVPWSFIYSINGTVYGNTIITNGTTTVMWISKLIDLTDVDIPVLNDQRIIYRDAAAVKFKLKASPSAWMTKPSDLDAINSVVDWYVAKKAAGVDKFERSASIDNIWNNYLILTGTMAGTPPDVDITDTRITDTTPYLVFFETQPVGNITRTLTNGNLHIESDDNADTLDVKVVFMGIWPARQYMKWVFAFTGTTHQILDPRIIASSAVVAMPRPTPVGYITGSTDVGEINFSSTGTEIWVIVDYVVFNDGVAFSDWMAYNATLSDDDIMFRKNSATGVDEAFKVSDLTTNASSQSAYDTSGTSSAYTVTIPNVPSYADNTIFMVRFHTTNVANATLNVNSLGDIPMLDLNGNMLIADILNTNNTYLIRYESSNGKMYVAEMLNVWATNNYQSNFLDLQPIETGRTDFPLTWMTTPAWTIYDWTRYIYITDETNNKVYKFDTRTNTMWPNVNVWARARWIIIDWWYIYVSCSDWNRIDKIDISTFTNVGNVGTSTSPQDMCVVGWFLYTACNWANKVDKINLTTFTNVGNVWTGTMLLYFWQWLASDWTYLYVWCSVSNRIDKIDLSTFTNIWNVSVWTAPNNILYYNWFLYVSCETWDRVDKIDTTTFLNVASVGWLDDPRPQWALVYNNYLYISCRWTDTIEKINLTTFLKEWVWVVVATDPWEIELVWAYLYALNQTSISLSRLWLNTLSAPSTWMFRLYFKTNWKLYRMDDTGAEELIGTQS